MENNVKISTPQSLALAPQEMKAKFVGKRPVEQLLNTLHELDPDTDLYMTLHEELKDYMPEEMEMEEEETTQMFEVRVPKPSKNINVENFPEEFRISNLQEIKMPEPPKFPKIPEFDDSKIVKEIKGVKKSVDGIKMPTPPDTVSVKKPDWYKPTDLTELLKDGKATKKELVQALTDIYERLNDISHPQYVHVLNDKKQIINKFGSNTVVGGGGGGGGGGEVEAVKVDTAHSNTAVTVGSSATTVLAAFPTRRKFILSNDSDETIYVFYGDGAEMNKGYRLNANGGSIAEESYRGIVTAICTSGGKNLTIIEI